MEKTFIALRTLTKLFMNYDCEKGLDIFTSFASMIPYLENCPKAIIIDVCYGE